MLPTCLQFLIVIIFVGITGHDQSQTKTQNHKSETDLLPRRILHQRGIGLSESGACMEDNKQ